MAMVFLALALGISCGGWLKNWLGLLTLAYYMESKGYNPPTEDEIELCSELVIRKILHRD